MTNEQQKAKELAELLNAFADGKQLQWDSYAGFVNMKYDDLKQLTDIFNSGRHIRIKPETKRVKLTMQDMIDRELSGKTMRLNVMELILAWNHNFVTTAGNTYGYNYLLDNEFTFLDGTPCYKEVSCE